MPSDQQNEYSLFKLSQLWHVRTDEHRDNIYSQERVVNKILEDNFDVNYKATMPKHYLVWPECNIHLRDCTALHFFYCGLFNIRLFDILLNNGADFTVKNGNGQTIIHLIVTDCHGNVRHIRNDPFPFLNSILSAHVKRQNAANPQDNNGISHLHAACITNHLESLKLFLDNGASVDQAVNSESPYFPGYTPLHFAVKFASFEAAQLLIERGATVNAKNSEGKTLLDLCIKCRLDEMISLTYCLVGDINMDGKLMYIKENEQIVKLLMRRNCPYTGHLSYFQLAFTFEDLSIAEKLINQHIDLNHAVPLESSICPGYTAAHFAVLNSIDAIKLLGVRGATLESERLGGLTLLDICIKKYSIQEICDTLSYTEHCQEIYLSDGQTKLFDLILSMEDLNQLHSIFQNNIHHLVVPDDSPIWPGSTILHLAVILSAKNEGNWLPPYDETIVKECLERDLDVNFQNSRGQTSVHLAFRIGKENIAKLLLSYLNENDQLVNYVDEDNLSYLHIACAVNNDGVVEKLLRNSDPNIVYKGKRIPMKYYFLACNIESESTPLHVAVSVSQYSARTVGMLLQHGADINATDANGMTPIHWLLRHDNAWYIPRIANQLFTSLMMNPTDIIVDGVGLSYLHVACFFGHVEAVITLLALGSNVNAVINYQQVTTFDDPLAFLTCFSAFSPLRCAIQIHMQNNKRQVIDLLLRSSIDVFINYYNSSKNWPDEDVKFGIMLASWHDENLQKCFKTRLGLTKLHIVCYFKNEEAIRNTLDEEIDVNVQIKADSAIFAGCTPLHLLLYFSDADYRNNNYQLMISIEPLMKLLLDHGANVNIANQENDTPVHKLLKHTRYFADRISCRQLLLNAHSDFSTNPVNSSGLSHFHVACSFHEVHVIEKFLQHGLVDVNKPTDFFAEKFPGSTPLHLVLRHSRMANNDWAKITQTVDLLLKHGANVSAEDAYGETPLHKPRALTSPDMVIFEKLVSHGADMGKENVQGMTPLMKLAVANWVGYTRICAKYNCRANNWNRFTGEGLIGNVFLSRYRENVAENTEFEKLLQSEEAKTVDEAGRTAIHNSVAVLHTFITHRNKNYEYAIEKFTKQGIDVDHQDNLGRTALHYTGLMQNASGADGLLTYGADINIFDNEGNTALTYAMTHIEYYNNEVYSIFNRVAINLYLHVQKLLHLGLEVNQLNIDLAREFERLKNHEEATRMRASDIREIEVSQNFFTQIELTKTIKIGVLPYTLFDLLSETGMISWYVYLSNIERKMIDDFFNVLNLSNLEELAGIIRLQFKKMKRRSSLIYPAFTGVRMLLGFSFAGLCEDITMYLSNSDLKMLAALTV